MNTSPIVVIGAGILGVSIAYHLSRRNITTTLIDAGKPGQSTTSVSFAWMNARDKNPQHYHMLNRRSLDIWPRFVQRLGIEKSATWGGELRWAATYAGAQEIAERVQILQTWGYPIRLIDALALQKLEPRMTPGSVTAASYTDIDGHADTEAVVQACLSQFQAFGGQILSHTRVEGFSRSPTNITTVITDKGKIPCQTVVIATGADTSALAQKAGVEVPTHHTFGATLITEPIPPIFQNIAVLHTPRDADIQTNIRQLPNGSVMMHGGAHGAVFDGDSLGNTPEEIQRVQNAVVRYIPALEGVPIQEVRRGRRPIPNDGHPIIGFTRQIPNLYLAVMHSGVTLAPLVGESVAIEILDHTAIDFLEPYRLERFHQMP